jgi:hypothetical protein
MAVMIVLAGPAAMAQSAHAAPVLTAELALPDSPGFVASSSSSSSELPAATSSMLDHFGFGSDEERAKHAASTTDKYIFPNQLAPRLTASDKVQLGLIHGVSPYSVLGWFVSAGYSHVTDGTPNYGVDKGAFGERLGAAALRGYTEEVFTDSVMAPIFHQDPRYYKQGHSHTIVRRVAYAASRVVITRNDDGRSAPNYSLISGNLMAAALTNAYYPDVNRGLGQTAHTFGNAMLGAAASYLVSEFISGALEAVHLKEARN